MARLDAISGQLESVLATTTPARSWRARWATPRRCCSWPARGYPVALEGALKLKELAYLHAEGFAAGELKHGPIALIEDGVPVLCVVPPRGRDQLHDKMLSGSRRSAPAAPGRSLAEEGDERTCRTPTC